MKGKALYKIQMRLKREKLWRRLQIYRKKIMDQLLIKINFIRLEDKIVELMYILKKREYVLEVLVRNKSNTF